MWWLLGRQRRMKQKYYSVYPLVTFVRPLYASVKAAKSAANNDPVPATRRSAPLGVLEPEDAAAMLVDAAEAVAAAPIPESPPVAVC
jgi:hypothetical protein